VALQAETRAAGFCRLVSGWDGVNPYGYMRYIDPDGVDPSHPEEHHGVPGASFCFRSDLPLDDGANAGLTSSAHDFAGQRVLHQQPVHDGRLMQPGVYAQSVGGIAGSSEEIGEAKKASYTGVEGHHVCIG
jgi:hypothetical protein